MASEPAWMLWSRETSLSPIENRARTVKFIARHYTDWVSNLRNLCTLLTISKGEFLGIILDAYILNAEIYWKLKLIRLNIN